jgi:glyoxylase-like metal-dependent hydrolase (beta-lactamase superfamily II)
MSTIKTFTFNPFQENTYIVYDETNECVIIDPGCYTPAEKQRLADFITKEGLTPVRLLNTHCHLDHIFGNEFCEDRYGLSLEIHRGELPVLARAPQSGQMFGVPTPAQRTPTKFVEEGDTISFGNTHFQVILTPGHSPASICFYNQAENYIISGDVLFNRSIGRYDLPGGNLDTLLHSIRHKLFILPDETKVYAGHGELTSIVFEKMYNPFLNMY